MCTCPYDTVDCTLDDFVPYAGRPDWWRSWRGAWCGGEACTCNATLTPDGHLHENFMVNGRYFLQSLSIPELVSTGGNFYVYNNLKLHTLSLPSLTSTCCEFSVGRYELLRMAEDEDCDDLKTLVLPALTSTHDFLATINVCDGWRNMLLCCLPIIMFHNMIGKLAA